MSGYVRICQDMSGYVRICQDMSGYVRICQDMSGYVCQDMLGELRRCPCDSPKGVDSEGFTAWRTSVHPLHSGLLTGSTAWGSGHTRPPPNVTDNLVLLS